MSRESEIASILLDSNAVSLRPDKPFRYASGILSPIYCDNRILISLPDERKKVIDSFLSLINETKAEFEVVAGTATAGIPHAAWISDKFGKPMIYVRQTTKSHGKENVIEGLLQNNDNVIVIEDLISTGGSSVQAVKAIKAKGATVSGCFAIFTYEMKKAKDAFRDVKCPVHALSNFSTLVKTAKEKGLISSEDEKTVLEWNSDPSGWGRKMGFE